MILLKFSYKILNLLFKNIFYAIILKLPKPKEGNKMDFEGRNVLADKCNDFFHAQRQNYINFCNLISQKAKMYINPEDIEETMGLVYDSFMLKEPNIEHIKHSLKNTFKSNSELAKLITIRSLFWILKTFSKKNSDLNLVFVVNAAQRMILALIDEIEEPSNVKTADNSWNNSAFEGSGGFFIHQNITDLFSKIKNNNQKIQFLNLYKGVPIQCEGSIVNIENDEITFEVTLMQILAMMEEESAFIVKNDILGKHIKADIVNYYFSNNTVKLNNFKRLDNMPATQREFARVHPNATTNVALISDQGEVAKGILYDISEGGMGVLTTQNLGVKNGDILEAQLTLTMPNTDEKLEISEKVQLVVLIDYKGTLRYCMQNLPDQKAQNIIAKFVQARETQTLEDLKEQLKQYN